MNLEQAENKYNATLDSYCALKTKTNKTLDDVRSIADLKHTIDYLAQQIQRAKDIAEKRNPSIYNNGD